MHSNPSGKNIHVANKRNMKLYYIFFSYYYSCHTRLTKENQREKITITTTDNTYRKRGGENTNEPKAWNHRQLVSHFGEREIERRRRKKKKNTRRSTIFPFSRQQPAPSVSTVTHQQPQRSQHFMPQDPSSSARCLPLPCPSQGPRNRGLPSSRASSRPSLRLLAGSQLQQVGNT